jgi:hypothetical protein
MKTRLLAVLVGVALATTGCDNGTSSADTGGVTPGADAGKKADTGTAATPDTGTAATPDTGTAATPDTGVAPGPDAGSTTFTPPVGHAGVTFEIDDSANKSYATADNLNWKGSFSYDDATRTFTKDTSWAGPFPTLYDDGPYTTGGHEKVGAVKGDNKWGVVMWFASPAADTEFEYGAQAGSSWIWTGSNGKFTIPANSTATVNATGMVIPKFGTNDLKLTIDMNLVPAAFKAATTIKVKGSGWSWTEVAMTDDATKGDATKDDKLYTFVLGQNLLPHTGLLNSGAEPQFVFVLDNVEYKGTVSGNNQPLTDGVKAYIKAGAADWAEATVKNKTDGDRNTYVTVP